VLPTSAVVVLLRQLTMIIYSLILTRRDDELLEYVGCAIAIFARIDHGEVQNSVREVQKRCCTPGDRRHDVNVTNNGSSQSRRNVSSEAKP
jgi:hypothetical protein